MSLTKSNFYNKITGLLKLNGKSISDAAEYQGVGYAALIAKFRRGTLKVEDLIDIAELCDYKLCLKDKNSDNFIVINKSDMVNVEKNSTPKSKYDYSRVKAPGVIS